MTPDLRAIDEIHIAMEAATGFFLRSTRAGDGFTAGFWLNRIHDEWDQLEQDYGLLLCANLPEVGRCSMARPLHQPHTHVTWGATFEEPKAGFIEMDKWLAQREAFRRAH